ncbi:hypothetical protein AB0M28_21405 [Streptomyces sp. NPDC051940]|uniref:hypothetical protein n=1 Tax=Streptomyces sp. NPDC051940 TaxID=3155675 RepID=UPI00341AB4F7
MINVLVVAGAAPQAEVLRASLDRLAAADVRIRLVEFSPAAELSDHPALAGHRTVPAQRFAPVAKKSALAKQIWARAERDPQVKKWARRADVLVALDPAAVYTVWQLAQRNRSADAIFGMAPAGKAVADRRERPAHYARERVKGSLPTARSAAREAKRQVRALPKGVVRTLTGPKVVGNAVGAGAGRAVVSAPGLPPRLRHKLARHLGSSMDRADRPTDAARTLTAAARADLSNRARADLLREAARIELDRGKVPAFLGDAIAAEMACADALHQRGKNKAAAESVVAAWELAFHRVLHYDRTSSPLAEEPESFMAPLNNAAVTRRLSEGRGRLHSPADPPADRPLRILITTRGNGNFLREISERYENHPGVELRFTDLIENKELNKVVRTFGPLTEHRLGGNEKVGEVIEAELRPDLDWADIVFIDWCTGAAALFTAIDPGTTRIVIRLHSFEAFCHWPYLVDFSRVDDLVFVGAHLRDLTVSAFPQLRGPDVPRLSIIPNAMDLERFALPKVPEARFNLGLVGISAVAKDPRWAIEVLRRLRARDDRYRLFLVGEDLNSGPSAATRAYAAGYRADVAELEPTGSVVRLGQLSDVPQALTSIGVILSASVRESFHCGFVEGVASGAVPVGRDWPFFAGKPNGARTLFPDEWIVSTPQEAADRILAVTETQEIWEKTAQGAAQLAIASWDWRTVAEGFDRLLLPPDRVGQHGLDRA